MSYPNYLAEARASFLAGCHATAISEIIQYLEGREPDPTADVPLKQENRSLRRALAAKECEVKELRNELSELKLKKKLPEDVRHLQNLLMDELRRKANLQQKIEELEKKLHWWRSESPVNEAVPAQSQHKVD